MFENAIPVALGDALDLDFPRMLPVRQKFPRPVIRDAELALTQGLAACLGRDLNGCSVAVGVGSRGIAGQVESLRILVAWLTARGARPFIVPAMGSHGGATADGQEAVLAELGICEEAIGVPVRSSMDAVEVGRLDDGTALYCDRNAMAADGIIVCNKIKPHADFKGEHESGLVKMVAIGLGKHAGAAALHRHGFDHFSGLLPRACRRMLDAIPFRCGIAFLENAYDELMDIEVVPPAKLVERDRELLVRAKANIQGILVPEIDVLIVDEIGKNISGEGMDPNVTGRPGSGLPGFSGPAIRKIVVLDVTPQSRGNGVGIGMADITTRRVVEGLDLGKIYTNAVTAMILDPAKIPLVLADDRQAIAIAVRTCPRVNIASARIVRIKNTLNLSTIYVSESLRLEVEANPGTEVLGPDEPLAFDASGRISPFPSRHADARTS